ncbi:hypothetical protein BH23PSE1_BH23PSE1_01620 [soil metagenome]
MACPPEAAASPADAAGAGLPSLTVAVSTRGSRALGLDPAALPAAPGLDWLVLVQEPRSDPRLGPHLDALAARDGVSVARLAGTGLAQSRNAGLDRAAGEIVLIADDDAPHLPGALAQVRRFFAEHPGLDLLVGRALTPDGRPRRRPTPPRALTLFNAGRATSHEIAFRALPVREAGIRFDEGFGAGAGTGAFLGEEYIFLADCLRAGLKGAHRPIAIAGHEAASSGHRWAGSEAARAAVLARVFGRAAPLARAGFALRNLRRFAGPRALLRFLRG